MRETSVGFSSGGSPCGSKSFAVTSASTVGLGPPGDGLPVRVEEGSEGVVPSTVRPRPRLNATTQPMSRSRQIARIPASRSMFEPGRPTSSSSSAIGANTPLPVPDPAPVLAPESHGQKPAPPEAGGGTTRGRRAGVPSAGSGANNGRAGGGSNGGGGGAGARRVRGPVKASGPA